MILNVWIRSPLVNLRSSEQSSFTSKRLSYENLLISLIILEARFWTLSSAAKSLHSQGLSFCLSLSFTADSTVIINTCESLGRKPAGHPTFSFSLHQGAKQQEPMFYVWTQPCDNEGDKRGSQTAEPSGRIDQEVVGAGSQAGISSHPSLRPGEKE